MRKTLIILWIALSALLVAVNGQATEVHVYEEGSLTETTLTVNIFADIIQDVQGPLVSAAVRLSYPQTKLENPVASKNETDWYFGVPDNKIVYRNPIIGTDGTILFLLAKFDLNNPLVGVGGKRILLGTVLFDRIEGAALPLPEDFTITLGQPAPYANFVTTLGSELDQQIVFSLPVIIPRNSLYLGNAIRILQLLSGHDGDGDTPPRPAELDFNGNHHVDLADAIFLLQVTANEP